jgi:hypothetical protein
MVAYPVNAGLLMFPVVALFVDAFRRRAELLNVRLTTSAQATAVKKPDTTADAEILLWMWVISLFVVFSLPSQRDERYLLPAMPALAVLCALNWQRINQRVFMASTVATGVAVVLLAYLSIRLEQAVPGARFFPVAYWALLAATAMVVAASLVRTGLARSCVNVAILLALASFAGFLRPFDGASGTYAAEIQHLAKGRTVWVPVNFAAREEAHRFLLPGADVRGYVDQPSTPLGDLAPHSLVAIRVPIGSADAVADRVLGQRLDIATRHTPDQIVDMLRGNVFQHLFVREVLVEADDVHQR